MLSTLPGFDQYGAGKYPVKVGIAGGIKPATRDQGHPGNLFMLHHRTDAAGSGLLDAADLVNVLSARGVDDDLIAPP